MLQASFLLQDVAVADVTQAIVSDIAVLIETALGLPSGAVQITGIRAIAATRRQRALTNAGVGVDFVVVGLADSTAASAAQSAATTYLGSGTFVSALQTNLPALTSVASVSASSEAVAAPTALAADYPNSCDLSPRMSVSWRVNPDGSVSTLLSLSDESDNKDWVSAGLVRAADFMVPKDSHRNSVYLYDAIYGKTGYFRIDGYTAGDIVRDTSSRAAGNKVDALQVGLGAVLMAFTEVPGGVDSASAGYVLDAQGSNIMLWAHGGGWPVKHLPADRGFIEIFWGDGTCVALSKARPMSPFIVFVPIAIMVIFTQLINPTLGGRGAPLHWVCRGLMQYKPPFFHLLDDVPLGSILIVLLHMALCVIVGDSTYRSNSFGSAPANGADKQGFMRAVGVVALMNLWVSLLPTAKTTLWMRVTGVSYERGVKYHKLVVGIAMLCCIIHLIVALDNDIELFDQAKVGEAEAVPIYGTIALLCFLTASTFANDVVRMFIPHEVFKITHNLTIVGVVFAILHLKLGHALFGFIPGIVLHCELFCCCCLLSRIAHVWFSSWRHFDLRPGCVL